ncbi:hypothetical protein G6F22_018556 [Rhizopus arrhizus]|nr:hypothetical protein G6F22_018556 [Rhizopus arrhizus]
MPMRPSTRVTRPAANGPASACSSVCRRLASAWRCFTSWSSRCDSSSCTATTPTRISTKAPSSTDIRSPKAAQIGACEPPSTSSSSLMRCRPCCGERPVAAVLPSPASATAG